MPIRLSPEESMQKLGRAVLEQALDEYIHGTPYARSTVMLFFESGDFEMFCHWADVDPKKMYDGFKAIDKRTQGTLDFY